MIALGPEICTDLEAAREREWLETNGLGGFASSTVAGLNSRRYHGLLVAALSPPTGRMVLLAKLEETLVLDGQRFELSANQYPGVIHPQGYRYLRQFRRDPYPVFTYAVEGAELEKSISMLQGENTTVVRYVLRLPADRPPASAQLELRPLIAFRDYHSLTHENGALNPAYRAEPGLVSISPYGGLPELLLAHDGGEAEGAGCWYRNFEYAGEQERGLDFQEDLFNPCVLVFDLARSPAAAVIASTQRREARRAAEYQQQERERRAALGASVPADPPLVAALTAAADQFIVAREAGKTIIAGYHWFTDWGRDTMIALPGLTLATGRPEVGREILSAFAPHVSQGMLPNRFPDSGQEPEYNTVDATLWYFEAVNALLRATEDYEFVRSALYETLVEIIDWHVRGTRYGIRVDADGLLLSGAEGVQLTWMDAKVGDWVVTPRRGKPVEIQALWYNALRVMEDLSRRFRDADRERQFGELAGRAKKHFEQLFWNPADGCLYDCVDGESRDPSIRPNQVLAISLPHSMLARAKAAQALQVVEWELLTPAGLRSLAPSDPRYVGRYTGGPWQRDGAYHQGTVWPWLMGPFLTAYLRVHRQSRAARAQVQRWLGGFEERLADAGLGQISEIAEGDPPHRPCGCIAQAWSVAELLRVAVEESGGPPAESRRPPPGL
jgi:predicted glycogen debranching enzyme